MRMILLAAGQGTRLRPLTDTKPKCLIELGRKSLLDWQLEVASLSGISDVVVVGGYMAEQLTRKGLRVIINPNYGSTNMAYSLFCAEAEFGDGFILSYGDIVYSPDILKRLMVDQSPIGVIVDRDWHQYWKLRFDDPLCDAESMRIDPKGRIKSIGQQEIDINTNLVQNSGY